LQIFPGAIPFVRTNVPQTLIIHAAENPIYGRTDHHLDARRTPGGSSSGEGPLIALGGSPLGIGTDALGSVRIPASFCGIVAFKVLQEINGISSLKRKR
jgi:Asp-tRNA(Asn)/Glu-tRNA(Gln) amidotransferase A subunit family amidase